MEISLRDAAVVLCDFINKRILPSLSPLSQFTVGLGTAGIQNMSEDQLKGLPGIDIAEQFGFIKDSKLDMDRLCSAAKTAIERSGPISYKVNLKVSAFTVEFTKDSIDSLYDTAKKLCGTPNTSGGSYGSEQSRPTETT